MKTLKDVRRVATIYGATVEDDKVGNTHECRVCTPKGKRWVADEIHEFITSANRPWKPDYDDLIDRMSHGVEDCGDNCEWCET